MSTVQNQLQTILSPLDHSSGDQASGALPVQVYYRNNPDGTVRWAWPARLRTPLFLRFYNTAHPRAARRALLIRWVFRLRLPALFASGKTELLLPARLQQADWALFTGTAGVHRTALIFQQDLFLKWPLGEKAPGLLEEEARHLQQWSGVRLQSFQVPALTRHAGFLAISDIGKGAARAARFGPLHWAALEELAGFQPSVITLSVWPAWKQAGADLKALAGSGDQRVPRPLLQKLSRLYDSIPARTAVPAAQAHGDFTPWNILVHRDRLGLIDWERAAGVMPLLADFFHFQYQQAALVEQLSYTRLHRRLEAALDTPAARSLVQRHQIDTALHHRIYLLTMITQTLQDYRQQAGWSSPMQAQLRLWDEALTALLLEEGHGTARQWLLADLFHFLEPLSYAALKWPGGDPRDLSEESDLDLAMPRDTARKLENWLRRHPLVRRVKAGRRSFMRNLRVQLRDGGLLSLDCIWQIKRKDLHMMPLSELLSATQDSPFGVRQPRAWADFTYTWLFYWLNGKSVPPKYRLQFQYFSEPARQEMENGLSGWKEIFGIRSYTELFQLTPERRQTLVQAVQKQTLNRGWHHRWSYLAYLYDAVRTHLPRRGFTVTFSGVDGAGKSTVIEAVRRQLEKRYRRQVVVLRHRPAVLPMLSAWKEGRQAAEQRAATRLPRQGKNRSIVSSLLRFGYYYTDYLLGQFVIQCRYVWRGYIVLYDRYYFDFIHDARRSNIHLPPGFTAWGYRLLLKPRYNFFLYADAATILARKKELDSATISKLTGAYRRLFRQLARRHRFSRYITIENRDLPVTLRTIQQQLHTSAA